MRGSFLYISLRVLVRAILRVYFKRIEIVGAANIPPSGPVIFAANHPQSITDALVLGTHCRRTLHYLAHSGLFSNHLRAWFLGQLGVIPVYRKDAAGGRGDADHGRGDGDHDRGEPDGERNVALFSACHALLARGGCIGIFPEGVSLDERRVQTLKTGTARIGLESEASHAWSLGVRIVPVGLNFESTQRFRSRVLVSFGEPIAVRDWCAAYKADAFEAIHQLTSTLHERIRRLVVDIERVEFEDLVRDLELVYKGELLGRRDRIVPGGTPLQQEQRVSREIALALDHFLRVRPVVVWRVRQHLEAYRRKLTRLHLQDEQIREHKRRTVPGEVARLLLLGALGLPVALYGALWNMLPYRLTGWMARRHADDQTKFHFLQLTVGSVVYPLYYVPLGWYATHVLGPMDAVVFAVTLPPTGLFARAYAGFMGRRRRMLRFAMVEFQHRLAIQRLRQERHRLIAAVDTAFEEYVAARDAVAATGPESRPVGPERGGDG